MNSLRLSLAFRSACMLAAFTPLAAPVGFAASATPENTPVTVPVLSADEQVQKDLATLNKALDANPKLEEALRANLDQVMQGASRVNVPEVDALLKAHPGVVKALKTERNFLLHRGIARVARGKLFKTDAEALDKFLNAHPDVLKALEKRPAMIVNGDFLVAHPQLAQFLEQHPSLSTLLLERSEKKKGAPKAPAKS